MYIIFGLGNPGPQYVGTRHNAGFELVDLIADGANIQINKIKFKSMVGEGLWNGEKIILIKPMTFMNLSGEAVVAALNFYKPKDDEWVVVYDDIALKPGAVRIREKGSAGGHNGMKSIIGLTGSDEFTRVRIGVGGPRGNVVTHVLGKFSQEEEKTYVEGLKLARDAVKAIMTNSVADAMNKFNSSGKPPKKPKGDTRVKPSAVKTDLPSPEVESAGTGLKAASRGNELKASCSTISKPLAASSESATPDASRPVRRQVLKDEALGDGNDEAEKKPAAGDDLTDAGKENR